jgi:hypothetical protein
MADGMQHRNETARQAYCPGTVLLDQDGVHSTPLTGANVWRPCVNPADLPLRLWLRDSAALPSVSVLRQINRRHPDCAFDEWIVKRVPGGERCGGKKNTMTLLGYNVLGYNVVLWVYKTATAAHHNVLIKQHSLPSLHSHRFLLI